MTDFEEWAKGYMRRSANLEQSVRQRWIDMQDSYEAGYLKGYGVGRRDAFAAGRRAGMEETIKIVTSHYSGSGEMTDTDYVLAHIISDMGLTRYD
jgi:hypothetical protein